MPSRKPSGSTTGLISPTSNSSAAIIRTHRSNDSYHAASQSTLGLQHPNPPTVFSHQQKIIQVLVGRLWVKLPCNSGLGLTQVETDNTVQETIQCLVELSRDSLDVIAIALTDLLDKIARHSDPNGPKSIDVVQSQLFVLKVLSVCMASRWYREVSETRSSSRTGPTRPPGPPSVKNAGFSSVPGSPAAPSLHSARGGKRSRHPSTEHLATPAGWVEPPPLDDACAKYILAMMVSFLRQTAPPESRLMSSANLSFEATFHDFESIQVDDGPPLISSEVVNEFATPTTASKTFRSYNTMANMPSFQASGLATPASDALNAPIPQLNTRFERTHKALAHSLFSLNAHILKFAGRIVYHLSASNWQVVLQKIQQKIRHLASSVETNPDFVDLYLMKHSAIDRLRLVEILQEISSLLVGMSIEAKMILAVPLRTAIWNWIDLVPQEFNAVLRSHRRLEGAPERVFDILWDLDPKSSSKVSELARVRSIWPTLAVLSVISPERTATDYQSEGRAKTSSLRFLQQLQRSAHSGTQTPTQDVAIVCLLDICRGAARAQKDDDIVLRQLAGDIVPDIKSILLKYDNQKPFWECQDEIDIAMFADALVAIFRFSPKHEALQLFETCLEPERSDAVKLVAVKACGTLSVEQRTIPWQPDISELIKIAAPRMRSIFGYGGSRRNEIDKNGNLRRAATRPKAKRFTAEPVSDRELLIIGVMHVWRSLLAFFITDFAHDEIVEWVPKSLQVWEQLPDTHIQYSIAMGFNVISMHVHALADNDPLFSAAYDWKLQASSNAVWTVANALLNSRMELDKQRMWAEVGHSYALVYIEESKGDTILAALQATPERVPALTLLELACAVSLTSADQLVSRLAAHTLRVLAIAERQDGAPVNKRVSEEDRGRRYPIYEQIGDPKFRATGRLAWQKRVRRLFSTLAIPHPYFIAIWEECYYRWCALTELVIRAPAEGLDVDEGPLPNGDRSLTVEEQKHQWQNLTLFLAACGGACLVEQHDPLALQQMIPPRELPDSMRVLKDPRDLIANFISYLIDLLLTDSVMARETAKEALGSELSYRLHGRLLKHLDDVIQDITRGDKLEWNEHFAVFLEQFIAVLKLLAENTQKKDEMFTVDIIPTLYTLADFINRFSDPDSFRIRSKFCILCDSLFSRPDVLSMRKEDDLRQHVLDILLEWIQNPNLIQDEEAMKTQHEANIASLRAAVHFLDRLELRSLDGNTGGDEAGHVAMRLFIRYSNSIFRSLDFVRSSFDDCASESTAYSQRGRPNDSVLEIRELVIKGLSRLISANTESGVKHSLQFACDSDPLKRLVYTKVFSRVMGQGTKLDTPETITSTAVRNRLSDMIKGPDITIALAICETCPGNEVDVIIPVLLNIMDSRQSLMSLMKVLIDREIARTDNETDLFRQNSTCTRLLSAFARVHGYTYLRDLIIPLIKAMEAIPPGRSYILDPTKVSREEREQNQKNVEIVALSFLKIISASVPALPSMFRELCQHIGLTVNNYWPEAKFAALGAFIFLRFISPAVVSPDIVDVELPKENTVNIRKGLMIVAKIIQNLANNIFFGKEAHMASLNKFLEENIINVTRFLSDVNKFTPSSEDDDEWVGAAYDDTDTIVLHRFFDKHADKVGKELLSVSKPSTDEDTSAINGKRAWDAICAALVELGQPIDIPRHSQLTSAQHPDYLDLMSRYSHRSVSTVENIFVETFTAKDEPAVFVLFVSKMDVETLDIDLLLYHIFRKLTSPEYSTRNFSIIYDWTSFNSTSQIPMQWLKYCIEMVPSDIRERFDTLYTLNINAAAHQYLRRVYNVTAGSRLSKDVKTCSSFKELSRFVPATSVAPLVYARSLEEEPSDRYSQVLMRQHHNIRISVTIEIGTSHLRILSDKAQPITPTLSCKPVEIIPFNDISDVYNVSSAHDPSEFIIRKARQATTLYFSTPLRDAIVKGIRAAKGRMRSNAIPGAERLSRFSNVSATLLHVALMNIGIDSSELRGSSYELLSSVIASFNLDTNPILSAKGVWPIDGSVAAIIPTLSDKIASAVPHLTLDFISEVCNTLDKAEPALRMHCISYMVPWLKHLSCFVDPTSACYDHSGGKLRDCIRALIDLTLAEPSMIVVTQRTIWQEIGKLETSAVNIILDELMRTAIDGGMSSQRCETICLVMQSLSSINVRGQIFSKMRKALGKTSVKPTRDLAENAHWNEIATLSRLALITGQHGRHVIIPQFYLPELLHLVTLIAATGDTLVRSTVWALVLDILQALWMARASDAIAGPEIQHLHDEASMDGTLRYFGLKRSAWTNDLIVLVPKNEKEVLDNQEGLVAFLMKVLKAAAQTKGLLNTWRARWMSLVTSTAFQVSPAVQARAFIVLGALASSDVDDDFFYQMLVALKTALSQFSETDTLSVVSMLRCIRNVIPALLPNSRYLPQVFWLAVALLQSSHIALFPEAASLLCVTMNVLNAQGLFAEQGMSAALLEYRGAIEDIASQLDQLLGLSFDTNFSFSLAAIVFKGVRYGFLRETSVNVLRTLLRVAARSGPESIVQEKGYHTTLPPDALGFFLALLPVSTSAMDYKQLLMDSNIETTSMLLKDQAFQVLDDSRAPRVQLGLLGIVDSNIALLAISFLRTMIMSIPGDDAETEILCCLLADIAMAYPDILALTYDGLQDKIKETFATSSNPAVLKAASSIFHIALQDQNRSAYAQSNSSLSTVDETSSIVNGLGRSHLQALEDMHMNGLASPIMFIPASKPQAATKVINWISELVLRIVE